MTQQEVFFYVFSASSACSLGVIGAFWAGDGADGSIMSCCGYLLAFVTGASILETSWGQLCWGGAILCLRKLMMTHVYTSMIFHAYLGYFALSTSTYLIVFVWHLWLRRLLYKLTPVNLRFFNLRKNDFTKQGLKKEEAKKCRNPQKNWVKCKINAENSKNETKNICDWNAAEMEIPKHWGKKSKREKHAKHQAAFCYCLLLCCVFSRFLHVFL